MRQSLPTPQCALIFTQEEEKHYEDEKAASEEIERLTKDNEKLKAKIEKFERDGRKTKV